MCGITSLRDAQYAVNSGADALGFVFYKPSPRYINPKDAADIIKQLPPFVTSVGLFVDEPVSDIEQCIQITQMDLLQFHGNESAESCMQLSRPYIKAIRVKPGLDLNRAIAPYQQALGILLDTYLKGTPGGTGESFNWELIPDNLNKPIILAGGLSADNISDAINTVKPYAVDVSGGIESQPGVKSQFKISDFMKQIYL